MMHYYGYYSVFGWIWMILFWGAVIWLIVWLVNKYRTKETGVTALDTLKKRYANGEITKKEYDDMRKEIMK